LNPSFRPPPPLPSSVRKAIYNARLVSPELDSVRALSQRYWISLKRVEAVLRLKQLEKTWKAVSRAFSSLARPVPGMCPLL
ncbi:hypothetical protein BOTBODRAFT_117142, partial [Botryobasidium botryosum FD-172 SS1]